MLPKPCKGERVPGSGRKKGTPNRETLTFRQFFEQKGICLADEIWKFYGELQDPLKNFNTEGLNENFVDALRRLFNESIEYKRLRLETIKTILPYTQPRFKEVEVPTKDQASANPATKMDRGDFLQVLRPEMLNAANA